MFKPDLVYLFKRYISQDCTESERQEFLALIRENNNQKEIETLMDELWDSIQQHDTLSSGEEERILSKVFAQDSANNSERYFWSVAVAILIGAIATGFWYSTRIQPVEPILTLRKNTAPASEFSKYVKLPDGSTVILNAGSSLSYPDSFEGLDTREVALTGEGYFDVTPGSKPFVVYAGKVKTTVLGTAFNIKAFAEDKKVTVTVIRGKVKVEEGLHQFGVLTLNDQVVIDTNEDKAQRNIVNGEAVIGWMMHDVFFDDITFADAARELESRFKVRITITNEKLKNCRFTMTFVKGERLDQILRVLCRFNGADYKYDESGTIVINGNGC